MNFRVYEEIMEYYFYSDPDNEGFNIQRKM